MNVARILFPVQTLGPGNRIAIWLCGCHRRCKGCSNPELWHPKPEYEIPVSQLSELVDQLTEKHKIDGVTITGGEPLDQAEELNELLDYLLTIHDDILLYTGYNLEEILADRSSYACQAVYKTAVVVDGVYLEDRNNGRKMVGSDNQRVFIVRRQYETLYRSYLQGEGSLPVQNFAGQSSFYSIGIHKPDFAGEIMHRITGREESESNE